MPKLKVSVSTGYSGCRKEDEIELDTEELEGKSPKERDALLAQIYEEWLWGAIDTGYELIEDESKDE